MPRAWASNLGHANYNVATDQCTLWATFVSSLASAKAGAGETEVVASLSQRVGNIFFSSPHRHNSAQQPVDLNQHTSAHKNSELKPVVLPLHTSYTSPCLTDQGALKVAWGSITKAKTMSELDRRGTNESGASFLSSDVKQITQFGSSRALGIFSRHNIIRRICIKIIHHKVFRTIVLGLILANCCFLALTQPFADCCTEAEILNDAVIKVDVTNFTRKCNMYNEYVDADDNVVAGYEDTRCCIEKSQLVNDTYNKCASPRMTIANEYAEVIFNVLFTAEMSIKIVAMGFITSKGTYLRDGWNLLDFVVVFVGWLSYVPGIANLSSLRTFRVLRPLRTLSSIPGMRPIVSALISSIRSMVHVSLLCAFLFTVFGIVGLQLFSGTLTGRCYYVDPTLQGSSLNFSTMTMVEADSAPCPLPCESSVSAAEKIFPFSLWTRTGDDCLTLAGIQCFDRDPVVVTNPYYDPSAPESVVEDIVSLPSEMLIDLPTADSITYQYDANASAMQFRQYYPTSAIVVNLTSFCLNTNENQLGDGYATFDSIGYAWLTILTSITLEGWTDVMYGLDASFGHSFVIFMYFFIMIWMCSFFMLELTLAVINESYENARAVEEMKAHEAEAEAEDARQEAERRSAEEVEINNQDSAPDETLKQSASATGSIGSNMSRLSIRKDEHGRRRSTDFDRQASVASAIADGALLEPYGPRPIQKLFQLVNSDAFTALITLLIVLNTITLGMEHYNMSTSERSFLNSANLVFTVAFTVELVLKVIGLGPRQYAKDFFNLFDFVIVTISLVELIIDSEGGGKSGLGALRTFRLMRIFKLARSWKNLRKLLHTILLSIMDVTNAAILLVIIMFIFTLLGMQLFGGRWTANFFCDDPSDYDACIADTPRPNFDSFWWGFVTVFQVLTGENWNELLYIGKRVNGEIAWVYFVSLNMIGAYMVLNLFLAILLARFEADDKVEELEEIKEALREESKRRLEARLSGASVAPMPLDADKEDVDQPRRLTSQTFRRSFTTQNTAGSELGEGEDGVIMLNPNKLTMHPTAWALFLFPPEMNLRQKVFRLINSGRFDNFILCLITVSTVLLAIEEPYVSTCKDTTCKTFYLFLRYSDIILNILFISEMLLKMFALGIVLHQHSYLRSGWNILDFIIVGISTTSLVLGSDGALKALKSLRSLRALRPLRVISRSPGMRLVVNAIIAAIPAIANVSVVVFLFMFIFAIIGVQNFSGGLNGCNDPSLQISGATRFDCLGYDSMDPPDGFTPLTWIPTFDDCSVLPTPTLVEDCLQNGTFGCSTCMNGTGFPRVWGPNWGYANTYNYDNIGQALLLVFEVVSGEMWPDIMYSTMDIEGSDEPMLIWPHRQHQSVAIWFILVILVCSFLMINVFVGVIIDNFNDMKDKQNGSGLLTEEQKLWLATIRKTMQEKPIKRSNPPTGKWRSKVWQIVVNSKRFEFAIMGVILLNTIVMMMHSEGVSTSMTKALDSLNLLFLAVFSLEAIVKLFALRLDYFKTAWNCFDISLVFFGYLGLLGSLGPIASLLRIFRVARIFRLVRTSPGLLTIFRTLVFSVPAIINVAGIFLLLILIYAILGMNLFSKIKYGDFLNEDANFDGFWISVVTLFRCSTGESYNGIMHDCMIQEPYCSNEYGNCGYPQFAPLYFCSFFIFSSYTLLSMITAIILDQFADQGAALASTVREEHIDAFKEEWAKLDPKGTMFIKEDILVRLVSRVPYPLGVFGTPRTIANGLSTRKLANALIRSLDIPTIHGRVSFSDVLTELTSKAMPEVLIPEDNQLVQKLLGKKEDNQAKLLRKMGTSREHILYNAAQVNAIMLLQSAMRGYIYRAKLADMMQATASTDSIPIATSQYNEEAGQYESEKGTIADAETMMTEQTLSSHQSEEHDKGFVTEVQHSSK